jgi:hypothetical protein
VYSQVQLKQRRISYFPRNSCILSSHCVKWSEGEWSCCVQPLIQSHCFIVLSQQRELYPLSPSTSSSYSFSSSFPTKCCVHLLSPKLTCMSKCSAALFDSFITHETAICRNPLIQTASVVWWLACWPLVPKFAGSDPAEAVGFFGRKNPQHAFLRRGSKAVDHMSQLCGMLKNPTVMWKSHC